MKRRQILSAGASAIAMVAGRSAVAADPPGVTATEIKIGNIMPYSGPASAYGVIGRTEAAYFKMINDKGGINGRKLEVKILQQDPLDPAAGEQDRPDGDQLHDRQRRRRPQVERSCCLAVDLGLERGPARPAEHEDDAERGEAEEERQRRRRPGDRGRGKAGKSRSRIGQLAL